MRYYRLHIDNKNDLTLYNKISEILSIVPHELEKEVDEDYYNLWTYAVEEKDEEKDEEPYYDFINKFLDIIEPKLNELKEIGIYKEDIVFWMVYEYDQQCGMEFHPSEMKRLGENGIVMCIDCYQK